MIRTREQLKYYLQDTFVEVLPELSAPICSPTSLFRVALYNILLHLCILTWHQSYQLWKSNWSIDCSLLFTGTLVRGSSSLYHSLTLSKPIRLLNCLTLSVLEMSYNSLSLTLSMPWFSVSIRTWCVFATMASRGLTTPCLHVFCIHIHFPFEIIHKEATPTSMLCSKLSIPVIIHIQ